MFTKTVHLNTFPITVVVRAMDSQSRSPGSKTTGWLQGQLSLSFFQGQLNEYQELLRNEW